MSATTVSVVATGLLCVLALVQRWRERRYWARRRAGQECRAAIRCRWPECGCPAVDAGRSSSPEGN